MGAETVKTEPANGSGGAPSEGTTNQAADTAAGTAKPGTKAEKKKNQGKEAEFQFHEDIVITENEKVYAAALRKVFGIKDSEELGNVDQRIAELDQKNAAIIAKAKESVINAEIKALQGYDNKLLARLIDRSKLTVDDSGKVTGLDEAVKDVEAEFPSVRIKEEKPHKPFIPFNPAGDETESVNKTMNDLIRGKR